MPSGLWQLGLEENLPGDVLLSHVLGKALKPHSPMSAFATIPRGVSGLATSLALVGMAAGATDYHPPPAPVQGRLPDVAVAVVGPKASDESAGGVADRRGPDSEGHRGDDDRVTGGTTKNLAHWIAATRM